MTAVLPSSFLVTVFSVIAETLSSSDASRSITLDCEHCLAEVVGQVVRAAQQDREAIPRRILREIFFRNEECRRAQSFGDIFSNPFHNSALTTLHAPRTCSCEGMSARDLSGFEIKAISNSG